MHRLTDAYFPQPRAVGAHIRRRGSRIPIRKMLVVYKTPFANVCDAYRRSWVITPILIEIVVFPRVDADVFPFCIQECVTSQLDIHKRLPNFPGRVQEQQIRTETRGIPPQTEVGNPRVNSQENFLS